MKRKPLKTTEYTQYTILRHTTHEYDTMNEITIILMQNKKCLTIYNILGCLDI